MSRRPKTYSRPGYRSQEGKRREIDRILDRDTSGYLAELRRELDDCPATPAGYREATHLRSRIANFEQVTD